MLSQEIMEFLPDNLNISQLSSDAIGIINKVYQGEALSGQEYETLLNATESAAVLSANWSNLIASVD